MEHHLVRDCGTSSSELTASMSSTSTSDPFKLLSLKEVAVHRALTKRLQVRTTVEHFAAPYLHHAGPLVSTLLCQAAQHLAQVQAQPGLVGCAHRGLATAEALKRRLLVGSVLKSEDLWCSQSRLAQKGDLQIRCSARSGFAVATMEGMALRTKIPLNSFPRPSG